MPVFSNPILLYDGVCGLCNRLVQFTLRHDHQNLFRFASLQSPFAAQILARYGVSASDLNTFYVLVQYEQGDEQLLGGSDAVPYVLTELGGGWRACGSLWKWLPRSIRDVLYALVARNRYQFFGKLDACPMPDVRHRSKFLDT